MLYRTQGKDTELSLLGYGCMRFSKKGGRIDQEKTERELARALELGVNYFDTAYIYPGCEEALGLFAAKNDNRSRMLIATKMPHYTCKTIDDYERIFNEQLERLKTDYIDYYLIHMLTSIDSWNRCVSMGVPEWIEQKKREGKIRRIGFSYHGGREDFKRICDAYDWEFTQIQLNYLDAGAQAGTEGLLYAASRGLPVIIMEPLRGGRLASGLAPAAKQVFEQYDILHDTHTSLAAWGLQWLFNLPEVTCVLSGMNDIAQVEENCALASTVEAGSLSEDVLDVYECAIEEIRKTEKVGCTGCGYCLPCPMGIDIPTCFRCYNTRASEGWFPAMWGYIQSTALTAKPKNAGLCIGCGKCAKHCPQHIDIPTEMKNAAKALENPIFKLVKRFKGVYWKS